MSRIVQLAQDCAEVSECHRISGEDCFLLKVHVRALNDLEAVLDRFLVYGQTTSSLIVSTPVPPRPVLP
jgi:Lrp/AsnC family leucine-responsive transcriptional regulator